MAAEAPDLDVLGDTRGEVFGFAHHRGFTHSFLGIGLVAALVVVFVHLIWRLRGAKRKNPELPPRWGVLFGFAYLAGLSHILLDFTNSYGVRPFWPFSERWYSWDIVFIVEPIMWILLLGGLLIPTIFHLVNQEIGPRRKAPYGQVGAALALLGVVALWGVRDFEHRHAVAALEARLYEGATPIRVSAYPVWGNPFRWNGVVETKDFFAILDVDSLTPEVDPGERAEIQYKPEETAVTLAAKKSHLGRVYLDWAQYPITETETLDLGKGYIVHFRDLRFADFNRTRRAVLSASVELDEKLNVVDEQFGLRRREGSE